MKLVKAVVVYGTEPGKLAVIVGKDAPPETAVAGSKITTTEVMKGRPFDAKYVGIVAVERVEPV